METDPYIFPLTLSRVYLVFHQLTAGLGPMHQLLTQGAPYFPACVYASWNFQHRNSSTTLAIVEYRSFPIFFLQLFCTLSLKSWPCVEARLCDIECMNLFVSVTPSGLSWPHLSVTEVRGTSWPFIGPDCSLRFLIAASEHSHRISVNRLCPVCMYNIGMQFLQLLKHQSSQKAEQAMQQSSTQINSVVAVVLWLHIRCHYCTICNLLADEFSNYISNELPQKHLNLYLIQLTLLAIHHLCWH